MKFFLRFFANLLFFISLFLFYFIPVWILVSSLFTFMAFLFLVPFYMSIWVVLRLICQALLKSQQLEDRHVRRLERAIISNTRALKYNFYLSLPILFLYLGYLNHRGKI